jgi:glycerol-3-phosphate dehydrogenase
MNYLIEKVRNQFPEANLTCFGNYAGIRPLVRQEEGKPSSVSREHTIRRQGKTRLTSVFGGKWTTARLVACETLDILFPQTKGQSQTHLLRFGGKDVQDLMENGFPRADEQLQSLGKELNLYPEVLDHLIFNYGRNAKDVLAIAKENSDWLKPILPDRPFIRAEVIYAVRYEMAIRVADYLIRRSIFGRLRERGLKAAPVVAALMAKEMAWDENRQKEEVDFYEQSTRILK